MNAERLLAYYSEIAEAPNAVARLRSFILSLAVSGKLAPQAHPAAKRTGELEAVRARISEKASRTGRLRWKPSDEIAPSELPSNVPRGWLPVRINDTGLYINGLAFKPTDWRTSGTPIIRIQNLTDPTREPNYAVGPFPAEVMVEPGDVLVSWSATLEAFIWKGTPGVLNQHIFRVIPDPELTAPRYLHLALRAAIAELAESQHAHGLAMMHINRGPFLAHVLALPPWDEQKQIVAKFDELMVLCDELEAARAGREAARGRLAAASLARLNTPDPETFQADAHFALDALPALVARPDQIKQLRQTILTLGVQGLLSEQRGSKTGHQLAESLRSEQAELIRKRQLNPNVLSKARSLDDLPFVLPSAWVWVSLGSLIAYGPQNGISPKPSSADDAQKAITLTATTSGAFNGAHFKRVEGSFPSDSDYWLQPGDLLFQRGNTAEYVGMAAVYDGPPGTYLYPDLIIKVRVLAGISLRFVHLCAVAPYARSYFSKSASGAQATMPKINQGSLLSLPVPLPPLDEQHRIVAEIDGLMMLCDELEASLTTANAARHRLLEALLAEALAVDEPINKAA